MDNLIYHSTDGRFSEAALLECKNGVSFLSDKKQMDLIYNHETKKYTIVASHSLCNIFERRINFEGLGQYDLFCIYNLIGYFIRQNGGEVL